MGVMSCYRKNCDNIMCDTYVLGIGYVCNDCKNQFKTYLERKGLNPKTMSEIHEELEVFMKIPKTEEDDREATIDQFFNHYE